MFRTLIFLFIISFFFVMVQIDLLVLAFAKIGIPSHYVFTALYATLFGSLINIPLKKIPQEMMATERRVSYFGFSYRIPAPKENVTVLAINVGGAIVPVLISLYLLLTTGLYVKALIATALLTLITYRMAKPMPGIGITLPFFLPPLLAAVISITLSYDHAPVIAYVAGTIGTLLGADVLHLKEIYGLGAPVASIGGAGTFDGIFLNGILAVLLSVFLM
ncbi:MAG: DUF1614 domain-containing protein [Syntrophales bacterium]